MGQPVSLWSHLIDVGGPCFSRFIYPDVSHSSSLLPWPAFLSHLAGWLPLARRMGGGRDLCAGDGQAYVSTDPRTCHFECWARCFPCGLGKVGFHVHYMTLRCVINSKMVRSISTHHGDHTRGRREERCLRGTKARNLHGSPVRSAYSAV